MYYISLKYIVILYNTRKALAKDQGRCKKSAMEALNTYADLFAHKEHVEQAAGEPVSAAVTDSGSRPFAGRQEWRNAD